MGEVDGKRETVTTFLTRLGSFLKGLQIKRSPRRGASGKILTPLLKPERNQGGIWSSAWVPMSGRDDRLRLRFFVVGFKLNVRGTGNQEEESWLWRSPLIGSGEKAYLKEE